MLSTSNLLNINLGYYWVKHFDSDELKIMYFNGLGFEYFSSDYSGTDPFEYFKDGDINSVNIESYMEVEPPHIYKGITDAQTTT